MSDDISEERQKEEYIGVAQEALDETGGCPTLAQKIARTGSAMGYPSPPISSPQSRSMSAHPNAMDYEPNLRPSTRTSVRLNSMGSSSTCLDQTGASRLVEMDHAVTEKEGLHMGPHNEACSPAPPSTSSSCDLYTQPQVQDSATPPSLPT